MKIRLEIIPTGDILSEIIRKRNDLGISQKDLADRLNISRSRICQIETGRVNPSINQVEKIFKSMGFMLQLALTEIK